MHFKNFAVYEGIGQEGILTSINLRFAKILVLSMAKKRNTARQKVSKAQQKSAQVEANAEDDVNQQEEFSENPLLKLSKISKKEKSRIKSTNFTRQIEQTTLGISKSSLRRRKRKAKQSLKADMNDLLSTLPDSINVVNSKKDLEDSPTFESASDYIDSVKPKANIPNITKQTGFNKIVSEETKNFTSVLKNSEFRSTPFAALKNAISSRMQS